eukprot:scaffold27407_cov145-Isochrysis_galbana.AAC.4
MRRSTRLADVLRPTPGTLRLNSAPAGALRTRQAAAAFRVVACTSPPVRLCGVLRWPGRPRRLEAAPAALFCVRVADRRSEGGGTMCPLLANRRVGDEWGRVRAATWRRALQKGGMGRAIGITEAGGRPGSSRVKARPEEARGCYRVAYKKMYPSKSTPASNSPNA